MTLLFTCIKIFFARILDVSLNTIRTTFVLRGKTSIVAIIAFLEITIWFLVARTALNTELNLFIVLSYSGGYTTGTIIGTIITDRFIKTNVELLVISNKIKNTKKIKDNNFGVTILSKNTNQIILLIETNKRRLKDITNLINELDNNAFITIKETRSIINGYM
ncbi:MAG: DUF2179 domain-containing protein [Bacilli bacterium]|nr:DUF2179 domain-containing protein [Bacilli bacterium]